MTNDPPMFHSQHHEANKTSHRSHHRPISMLETAEPSTAQRQAPKMKRAGDDFDGGCNKDLDTNTKGKLQNGDETKNQSYKGVLDQQELEGAKRRAIEMASILPPDEEAGCTKTGDSIKDALNTTAKTATDYEIDSKETALVGCTSYQGSPRNHERQRTQVPNVRPGAIAMPGLQESHPTSEDDRAFHTGDNGGVTLTTNEDLSSVPIKANVVRDEEFEETIQKRMNDRTVDALKVQVSPVEEDEKLPHTVSSRNRIAAIGMFGVLALVVIMVLFLLSRQKKDNLSSLNVTSTGPPAASDLSYAIELFSPLSGSDILMDEASPQHRAVTWLVNDDPARLSIKTTDPSILTERYVVSLIYFSTGGENWSNQFNFLDKNSVCLWSEEDEGIGCNDMGFVSRIDLDINNLNGTIPSELSALSSLERFSVDVSSLHGSLPASVGDLKNLRFLYIEKSEISGSIPETYSKLSKLEVLWMLNNEITGSIPSDLFKIPSLEEVTLAGNNLIGPIPDFGSNQVRELFLSANMLTSTIPETIYMASLERMGLWGNQLSGTISTRLGNLKGITYIDMDANMLNGTIPTEIGDMRNIEWLYMNSNEFEGTIPSELASLTRLERLWLYGNYLSGSIPDELSSLNPGDLRLEFNNLTGALNAFCNKDALLTSISADCGGTDPELECPCCTKCCDNSSGECSMEFESVCRIDERHFEEESGLMYIESADTICECTGSGPNTTLSCSDSNCQSCNRDGTVCSINDKFHAEFDESGVWDYYNVTFRYVVGRNDTVTFESIRSDDWTSKCKVTVNGELCGYCGKSIVCPDGTDYYEVNCDNLGIGSVSMCSGGQLDTSGPLAVFAFQDPTYREGCQPRFFRALQ